MALRVFRKPVKQPTPKQSTKPERHCVSIHFGRYRVFSKTFHRVQGIERELSADISTLLYFHQYEDSYQISAEPDMSQSKQSLQFNPFFDLELDNLFIGDEENQTEVELEEIIGVLTNQILDKVLPAKNPFVDVVFTSFSEIPRFVKGIQEALEQAVSQRTETYTVRHLEKAAVHNASATFQFMQNKTIVNGQAMPIGFSDIPAFILNAAKIQFNDKLYKIFLKNFLTENADQNYQSGFPIVLTILEDHIKMIKQHRLYTDLLQHKLKTSDFHVRHVTNSSIELVISPECVAQGQLAMIDRILKESNFKLSQAYQGNGLPQLGRPILLVIEEGSESINFKAFQTKFEQAMRYRADVKVFTGPQLVEAGLRTFGEHLEPEPSASRSKPTFRSQISSVKSGKSEYKEHSVDNSGLIDSKKYETKSDHGVKIQKPKMEIKPPVKAVKEDSDDHVQNYKQPPQQVHQPPQQVYQPPQQVHQPQVHQQPPPQQKSQAKIEPKRKEATPPPPPEEDQLEHALQDENGYQEPEAVQNYNEPEANVDEQNYQQDMTNNADFGKMGESDRVEGEDNGDVQMEPNADDQ